MTDKEKDSLNKMIACIDKILRYTRDCTLDDFMRNEEKVDATIFVISQIGELVKNITEETIIKYNKIEWTVIKNLRNKIVHDYDGINLVLIWDIIEKDIPKLRIDLLNIINS